MTSSLPFSGMTQEQWVEFVEDVEAALDKLANESVDVETQGFGLLTMAVMTLCAANHPLKSHLSLFSYSNNQASHFLPLLIFLHHQQF